MNPAAALGSLLGLGIALGVITAVAAARGYCPHTPAPVARWRQQGGLTRRHAVALVVGVFVLIVTGWIAVALGAVALIGFWPALFGGGKAYKVEIERLEALASWTEMVRDQIATYSGLLEALAATAASPPLALAAELTRFHGRLQHREPLPSALRRLAEDIDSPTADEAIAALILNAHVHGPHLNLVLTALAADTRRQVEARRATGVEHQRTRRGTQIIMVATVVAIAIGALFMPGYRTAYRDGAGQLVLAVVVVLFAAGFTVLSRLSRWRSPARFVHVRAQEGPWS